MTTLQVFDPAMCCSTGVCGPGVDPVLPRFTADLDWLKGQGVSVERFNLSQQPAVFVANAEIKNLLNQEGTGCLPLILVNGRIVSRGSYPSREALARWVGIAQPLSLSMTDSCCGGSSSCC